MGVYAGPDVVENGLVLALDAGNSKSYPGSGTTWTDLSGNGNNGTLTNGPTFDGDNLGSIVFDGTDDRVVIPHNSSQNPTEITICSWVNQTDILNLSGRNPNIIGKTGNSGYRVRINGGFNTNVGSIVFFDRGSTNNITTLDGLVFSGSWYFIVGTGSAAGLKIYLNGTLQASNTTSFGGYTSTGDLAVGAASSGNDFSEQFYGKISQTLLYNRELTAQEIQQNYNATKSRFGL
jgi:hypothetical protein